MRSRLCAAEQSRRFGTGLAVRSHSACLGKAERVVPDRNVCASLVPTRGPAVRRWIAISPATLSRGGVPGGRTIWAMVMSYGPQYRSGRCDARLGAGRGVNLLRRPSKVLDPKAAVDAVAGSPLSRPSRRRAGSVAAQTSSPNRRLVQGLGAALTVLLTVLRSVGRETPHRRMALFGLIAIGGLLGCSSVGPTGSVATSSSTSGEARPTASSRSVPPGSSRADNSVQPSPDYPTSLTSVDLPGSPEVALFQRVGDDLNVLGWRPGEPDVSTKRELRGAMVGLNEGQSMEVQLSPDGNLVLIHAHPSTNGGQDTFRVFKLDETGAREVWHSTSLGSVLSAAFVPTGQLVITATGLLRRDHAWTIVDLSAATPAVHEIEVPKIPAIAPSATPDWQTQVVSYAPLAISANGRWVYALSAHAAEPLYRAAYRISIESGQAEPMSAFPTVGADRIVSPSLDDVSGRLLLAGPYSTAGHGYVEAWSPDAKAPDFRVDLDNVFYAAWTDNGGVVTAAYDRLPGPFTFRVLSLSAAGEVAKTLLAAQGRNAGLIGIQNGFAAAYVAGNRAGKRQLVVIRLSDGATSGIEVTEPDGLIEAAGLRP